jgi:hypothetical protein
MIEAEVCRESFLLITRDSEALRFKTLDSFFTNCSSRLKYLSLPSLDPVSKYVFSRLAPKGARIEVVTQPSNSFGLLLSLANYSSSSDLKSERGFVFESLENE